MKILLFSLLAITFLTQPSVGGLRALTSAEGCFQDRATNRTLPELFAYYRTTLDWEDLYDSVISNCAELAVRKRLDCFAVQFYGECWTSRTGCQDYMKYGPSSNCYCSRGKKTQYVPGELCEGGVGKEGTNFVYKIWYRS